MSWMYGFIVRIRNAMYARHCGIHHVPFPVISVGNITVGGTGKTPLVTWIVRRLRDAGHRPAIVMRGYASVDPSKADEAVEYHDQLQEIDIVVGGDRYANITSYLANGGQADCFVMDDGFQHRRLHRDLDIVVLDFLRDALVERMLPAGWLREPIEGLKRADAIVVSHTALKNPAYAQCVDRITGKEPIAWTSHHWTKLHLHDQEGQVAKELDWLMGKKVAVRLGIGYPGPVIEALVRLGAKISLQLPAGDHQPFIDSEIAMLVDASKDVDAIVMTLKDWVKARDIVDLSTLHCPVVVPNLVLEIVDGDEELETLVLSVFKKG